VVVSIAIIMYTQVILPIWNWAKQYTISITHTRDAVIFPDARNNIRVWIDYNNNGTLDDAGETVVSFDQQTFGTTTGSFTVPTTATLGNTRMRVTIKMSDDAGHTLPTPCDNPPDPLGYHGEFEDYTVNIIDSTAGVALSATATTTNATADSCDGTATVTATATGGVSPYTYLWSDSLSQTDSLATGLCAGSYSVKVTDTNGDSVLVTVTIVETTPAGTEENSVNNNLSVFPNPSNGMFKIQSETKISMIEIVNTLGATVYSKKLNAGSAEIDLMQQRKGIYFYTLTNKEGIITQGKMIVE